MTILVLSSQIRRVQFLRDQVQQYVDVIHYTTMPDVLDSLKQGGMGVSMVITDLDGVEPAGMAWIMPCLLTQHMIDGVIVPVHRLVVGSPTRAERALWELNCTAITTWADVVALILKLRTTIAHPLPSSHILNSPVHQQQLLQHAAYARTLAREFYTTIRTAVNTDTDSIPEWHPDEIMQIFDLVRKQTPSEYEQDILDDLKEADVFRLMIQSVTELSLPSEKQDVVRQLLNGTPVSRMTRQVGLERHSIWRVKRSAAQQYAQYFNRCAIPKPRLLNLAS